MSFGTLLTGNHRLSVRKREKLSPRNGQVDIDIVHGFSCWAYCSGTTYSTNTYVFRRKYTPNIYIYHPTKPWKRRRRMGSLKTMFPHRVPVAPLSTALSTGARWALCPRLWRASRTAQTYGLYHLFWKPCPSRVHFQRAPLPHSRPQRAASKNSSVTAILVKVTKILVTGEEGDILRTKKIFYWSADAFVRLTEHPNSWIRETKD